MVEGEDFRRGQLAVILPPRPDVHPRVRGTIMFRSIAVQLRWLAALVFSVTGIASAAGQTAESSAGVVAPQDVLVAEAEGFVEVRFIANDARSAQILVTNRGDQPLTLRLPAAFAGVPVLAQQQGAGFGAGGIGAQPQNVGGGGMQGGGMGGGVGGGMGGNPFGCWVAREVYGVHDPRWLEFREWMTWQAPRWLQDGYANHGEALAAWLHERPAAKAAMRLAMDRVLPEATSGASRGSAYRVSAPINGTTAPFTVAPGKTIALRSLTVCLDYGRREPTTRMPYRLVAIETVSHDPRLALVLGGLASGQISQKVAQAAAWHVSSGRTWEQLTAEVIDRAGGDPDVPVFSAAELVAAKRVVEIAARLSAAARPTTETAVESEGP